MGRRDRCPFGLGPIVRSPGDRRTEATVPGGARGLTLLLVSEHVLCPECGERIPQGWRAKQAHRKTPQHLARKVSLEVPLSH